jgi:hypothetical protein
VLVKRAPVRTRKGLVGRCRLRPTVRPTAPTEAQSVLHPSAAFEALNDRLLDLIAHYQVIHQALPRDGDVAIVLKETTDRRDQLHDPLRPL